MLKTEDINQKSEHKEKNTDYGSRNTGDGIDRQTALDLSYRKGVEIYDLFASANRTREKFRGNKVDLCSIINAKSGACPEDCSFCAQSAHSKTDISVYPLMEKEQILEAAVFSRENGVRRFCVVTSGKKPSFKELRAICDLISGIRKTGLLPCATLGLLDKEQLRQLRDAGLHRYHHNLETSEAFFSEVCTTHTYREKVRTIEYAKSLGLSICSGGIFGLGESWEDRVDMAFALRELGVDSVPVNFLAPVRGTPLEDREALRPFEALKIISVCRLILPDREIRVCGGRPATLRDMNSYIFFAGADGLLVGNYLTTQGRNLTDDLKMIRDLELEY
ncbi:MAG: biotin synthase BioB [Nitrospiraceae bacterium]|nr:MAG: biotin synthase BioB [Nitrospiraceae bacterium]